MDKRNIRTVEISATGVYALEKQRMNLDQLTARLAEEFRSNPNIIVYIRADQDDRYKLVSDLLDRCQRSGITRFSFRTEPTKPSK